MARGTRIRGLDVLRKCQDGGGKKYKSRYEFNIIGECKFKGLIFWSKEIQISCIIGIGMVYLMVKADISNVFLVLIVFRKEVKNQIVKAGGVMMVHSTQTKTGR